MTHLNHTLLLAQQGGAGGLLSLLVGIAFVFVVIAGVWTTFTKAGKPGWACIIPIYNVIVMLEIAGKPLWWIVLLIIPVVNFIIFVIIVPIEIAKNFGKGAGFGLGLAFLGFIFYPILGFGSAEYRPVSNTPA